MKTRHIEDAEQLIYEFNSLPNNYVFRGQADATWELRSSSERIIGNEWDPKKAKKLEEYSLTEFRARFHLYDRENEQPQTTLAWLAAMQHYGVPTRLIDFTTSPYVALYFAIESFNPCRPTDFAVFAMDYSSTMLASFNRLSDETPAFKETVEGLAGKQDDVFEKWIYSNSEDVVWITEPSFLNKRLDRQSGCFVLSGNRAKRLTELLDDPIYIDSKFTKFVIPSVLFESAFALLRKMNVNSKTLYGDLQGLGNSIRMQLVASLS